MEDTANLYTVDFELALSWLIRKAERQLEESVLLTTWDQNNLAIAKKAHEALKKDLYGED